MNGQEMLAYLKKGDAHQYRVYQAIKKAQVFEKLTAYQPTVCGTFPLGIHLFDSDVDVILNVSDFTRFDDMVNSLYGDEKEFTQKRRTIRGQPVTKATFLIDDVPFDLFGQDQPVTAQYAYLHMVIEHRLLARNPTMKDEVIKLKKQGYKTESAFCRLLGLQGDPYEQLIIYGKGEGLIETS
ncbi:DUF4269 domain-containing protein [Salipaludibacillus sp. LMS25]|uniref:DUF4269 domain-containing protein n=1 Tax=Salipaludibacillus sp. LMS25 TaxID=2924031 RepID=UPI0020D0EA36|nr:DUF4269 domain-containing protein [Salipaludibacillus sp. LMS25]UTR13738.1 DUF4269 domain-containing protein [Salipaludibacillus sp. LMS25]